MGQDSIRCQTTSASCTGDAPAHEPEDHDELPAWNVDPQTLPAGHMTTGFLIWKASCNSFRPSLDLDMSMIELSLPRTASHRLIL